MSILLNETPLGMVIATGTLLFVFVPLPSWPKEFCPQQYTVPVVVVVSAQMELGPTVISLNVTPDGMLTATGTALTLPVLPLPSWP
jgi:hypothetical protein